MRREMTERMEDYLRIIYEVERVKGYARLKDVSSRLGVRPPSAVEMLKKLHDMSLIIYERYGGIRLTKKGREIAETVEKRYQYVRKFLEILLVPESIALKDAHILEHRLHPETILQIIRFVEFVTSYSDHPRFITYWFEKFRDYCQERSRGEGEAVNK
jgi:DtxR family Mn-dependent transcriptional regulator